MKKLELELLALSESNASIHSYAVVLGEKYGKRKLPIIIGSFEAQAIAIELERMKPARPLTHDLFVSMAKTLGAQLKEVLITDLKEGVYFANLVWVRQEEGGKPWVQDARTSDALALAVRFACPIYTVESVLSQGGLNRNSGMLPSTPNQQPHRSRISWMPLRGLPRIIPKAIVSRSKPWSRSCRRH